MELSVAVRYGLNPIIIVLNNGGYGTFRPMMDGAFNDIQPWRHADTGRIFGAGEGVYACQDKYGNLHNRKSQEAAEVRSIRIRRIYD
jgi:TPP-dependent 2-oxoacid decarboxylase